MPSSRRPSFSATRRLAGVARDDRGLEPVQAQRLERVADDEDDTLGHVRVPAVRLVDPVADVTHLERAALHAAEAHLAREPAVGEEQSESVRGVEVALPFPRRAPSAERLVVECGIGAARLGHRLPPLQPLPAAQPDLAPRFPIFGAQGPQHHSGAEELRHVRRSPRSRRGSRDPRGRRGHPVRRRSRPNGSPGAAPSRSASSATRS